VNAQELLEEGKKLGFDIYPEITELSDFCKQVKIFTDIDVLFSRHGAQLTNCAFMNPYSVVMELNPGFYHPCFKHLAYYSRVNYLESV